MIRKTNRTSFFLVTAVSALCAITLAHDGDLDHACAPADGKAITERVRTGSGENTYESIPGWCQLPEGRKVIGPTHGGVVVDKEGLIYFSMDGGSHGILIYKPDGTFVKGIAEKITGMHGLTIREEEGTEFIYAAHLAGKRALKLKLDGTVVWSIGTPMESGKYQKADQYAPTGIAVAPNGDVFVADGYASNWIHQWDKDQKYIRSFGGPGKGPGQFQTCHGIALDPRTNPPRLLVCDRANRRLQHFDLDGKFIAVITENLRLPCAVSIRGSMVAVAELEGRVTIINEKNAPVAFLGDNPDRKQWADYNVPQERWRSGIFTAPHGVSFDKDGNVFVMDWNSSGRLSRLDLIKQK